MKKAVFLVKRRATPMLAAIVAYGATGRKGKILASEPIKSDFSNADLVAAARRLIPQVPDYQVTLPTGVDL